MRDVFCEVSYFVTREANGGVFCFIIMVWISASGVKLGPGHFFSGFPPYFLERIHVYLPPPSVYTVF